jgi:hypothetical protein
LATSSTSYYPTYTLAFVTGDTVKRRILIQDPDPSSPDPENPVMIPRDLTGYSARAQVRVSPSDPAPVATLDCSGLGVDGYIYLELTPAESAKCVVLPKGSYNWDLELTDPDGNVETVLGGPVKPKGDYTK